MPDTARDLIKQTISNTPGTAGSLTLSTASTGYLALGASDDGKTFTVLVSASDSDTASKELRSGCTYTHSTTTLTRGTLVAGTAIDLTSSAVVSVVMQADSGRRWDAAALEHSTVTGTSGAISAAVNTLYVADMSGWTADRTLTLPATAAVGDRVGVMVSVGDDAYEWLITANTGDTLNGVAGGTEWSRLFLTGEVVIMRCVVANSTWVVETTRGLTDYVFSLRQNGNVSSQQSMTANTWASIEGDVLNTTVISRGSSLTNVGTAGSVVTFTARRAGVYQFSGLVVLTGGGSSADKKVFTAFIVNGDTTDGLYMASRGFNSINNGVSGFGGSQTIVLAVGDTVVIASQTEDAASTINPGDNYVLFSGAWLGVS